MLPAACSGPRAGSEAALAAELCAPATVGRAGRAEVAQDRERSNLVLWCSARAEVGWGRVQLALATFFPEAHFSASCLQTPITPRLGNP